MRLRSLLYDKRIRDWFYQAALVVLLLALAVFFIRNAAENMRNAGISSGFDFLWRTSGIEVPFVFTGYTPQDNILALFFAGIVNTLIVSLLAIVLATILGFIIGLARLSPIWLMSALAGAYVELVRNIPLLFFVLFWYFGVIAALPQPRGSFGFFGIAFLNNRGLTIAAADRPIVLLWAVAAFAVGAALYWVYRRHADRKKAASGKDSPVLLAGLLLLAIIPLGVAIAAGSSTTWDVPVLRGFNYRGGLVLIPEFVALLAALVTYAAAFIAEIVRGGIEAVSKGQREAATALGLRRSQTLRFVVIPQALRVIVPPMTSQYLNILKNSSFGAAIAFPEIVSLFMGSALNNTGQAIEIVAMTLAFYLVVGLAVSALMNWYNARTAIVSR